MISSMTSSASFSERSARSASLAIASVIIEISAQLIASREQQAISYSLATRYSLLEFEEVPEQIHAGCCQNGFRMKLHPFHPQGTVTQPHDFALGRLRRHLQAVRDGCAFHQQ